ncbi:hypothetical protein FISHEDRAFT_71516 [Fistulina hepatica ATCC 64428]|uniref:Zf-MIZ-domain-containing protein n=1 Tax=Fistulina hepatica ATCC 64428 TaxID=1128425 RepID=A0A0D7AJF3_9AGAR|nr:hypothetical protein FISHEDRAFT_71516 [Fistulina hepatica ATCC 64428]
MTAPDGVWSDFEARPPLLISNSDLLNLAQFYRSNVSYDYTVDKLKIIVGSLNEECGTHLPKSGKKSDLIQRIVRTFDDWKAVRAVDKWTKALEVMNQVRKHGSYVPRRESYAPATAGPSDGVFKITVPAYNASGVSHYDPYSPAAFRRPLNGSFSSVSVPAPTRLPQASTGIRFKESPFYTIESTVSNVAECPESSSAQDRRAQTLAFTLTADHVAKLKASGSKYQLRLFCTSSQFYTPQPSAFRLNNFPCLIEFPPTCEVRVNNVAMSANLKGMKKKPGTAPPPDLAKYVRYQPMQNRIEMVYVNSTQPPQPKKYYLVVMLVQTTSVEKLVNDLKANHRRSSADVLQQMKVQMTEDDDIVAGSQKMSLKCPLSFLRVNTPCRSTKCVHPQCFDANSWFSVMEQTTTYLCPVCERVLDPKDLIIDEQVYYDEIVKSVPEDVDDVMVEADGEWHTLDNKYGSLAWLAKHPVIVPPKSPSHSASAHPADSTVPEKSSVPPAEVLVLEDSDDEDEGVVKSELFLPASARPKTNGGGGTPGVIDLTLDSDEEDSGPPPPPPVRSGKRKADDLEPSPGTWKKNRIDGGGSASAPVTASQPLTVRQEDRYLHSYPTVLYRPPRDPKWSSQ